MLCERLDRRGRGGDRPVAVGLRSADGESAGDACLYLDKTGCPWRYRPNNFGAWATVRAWHDRFRGDGTWSEIAGLPARAIDDDPRRTERRSLDKAAEPSGLDIQLTTRELDTKGYELLPLR